MAKGAEFPLLLRGREGIGIEEKKVLIALYMWSIPRKPEIILKDMIL